MEGIQIAIPSYKRPERLRDATLAMLKEHGVPSSCITVFVATKEEEATYKKVVPASLYGKMVIVGKPGVMHVRNFIIQHYPRDAMVVSIDDDVSALLMKEGKKLYEVPDIKQLMKMGFDLCKSSGRNMWGIYPIANHFFMKDEPSFDLKFIIGNFYGIINKKIMTHVEYKEDYELSLAYSVADGGVVRFNNIAAKTVLGAAGGIGKTAAERMPIYKQAIAYLQKQYPGLVRLNPKREGEILLARSVEALEN